MNSLFDPIQLGAITAPNRMLMAPMTRARGTREHLPTPMMATYYAQRASAGLIISEAIGVSQAGLGWPFATGIWNQQQIAGWRLVTDAVHAAGGRIIAQLWHMGRVVHPLMGGQTPISASATIAPGHAYTYAGAQPQVQARALRSDEIQDVVNEHVRAARNAMEAGFDGIQIHASNGYLIDQFLRDSDNHRDDAYGGSIRNRMRLLREIVIGISDAIGADRIGVRLSPNGETQGIRDSDPLTLFAGTLEMLSSAGIGHVELREPPLHGSFGVGYMQPLAPQLRPHFNGPVILNSDFDIARAQADLDNGAGDAVSFGRLYIANADLPHRVAHGLPLKEDVRETWFTQGAEGYIDY